MGALAVGLLAIALHGEVLAQDEPKHAPRLSLSGARWWNIDSIEHQVRKDVPIGTPADDVVNFLRLEGLRYAFFRADRTAKTNTILAVIDDVGRRGPFVASLSIYFELADDRIQSIRFRVEYL